MRQSESHGAASPTCHGLHVEYEQMDTEVFLQQETIHKIENYKKKNATMFDLFCMKWQKQKQWQNTIHSSIHH